MDSPWEVRARSLPTNIRPPQWLRLDFRDRLSRDGNEDRAAVDGHCGRPDDPASGPRDLSKDAN
jgi:hypothetical protein